MADQGPPVYIAVGTKPSAGASCAGPRVQTDDATGKLWCCVASQWTACGQAATSTALAANGSNCGAGEAAQGVDASGAAEGCFTPPGTYTLPDATAAVTGGVRLTGDLGGTATAPTVPGLASRSGTGACGANTWASTLNGAAAPTCTQPAFSNLSGSATPAQLPAATTALGAVKMAGGCAAGSHVSSIGAGGELTCSADSGGGGAGSANAVEVSISFGSSGGTGVWTTTVTGQAWVSSTSKIVCQPQATSADGQTVETYYVADLRPTVANLVAGTGFDLAVFNGSGVTGTFRFSCTGV